MESFPNLTGRNGKEMLSEKNGQVNMYGESMGGTEENSVSPMRDH